MKVLLTGPPRSGKSLMVRRLAEEYPGNAGGVLAAEILGPDGRRCGYEIQIVWSGPGRPLQVVDRAVLARADVDWPLKVGRYRVEERALQLAVQALDAVMHESGLVLLDEIGPLQCASPEFRDAVSRCVLGPSLLLGTISQCADPFIETIRTNPGVRLLEVTRTNRNHLAEGLKRWLCTV